MKKELYEKLPNESICSMKLQHKCRKKQRSLILRNKNNKDSNDIKKNKSKNLEDKLILWKPIFLHALLGDIWVKQSFELDALVLLKGNM